MTKPTDEKNVEVPLGMMKDLLTDSELRMIQQRFQILNLVEEGKSIRSIALEVGVGTDTVVRLIRLAERKGLTKNIRPSRKKSSSSSSSSRTSWIFGKSE
jgi:transposase